MRNRSLQLGFGGLLCTVWLTTSCSNQTEDRSDFSAEEFTREALVVDSHIDTPYAVWRNNRDVILGNSTLEFDYPRAVEGGLDVAFMVAFVPPSMEEDGTATEFADKMFDYIESLETHAPSKVAIATCTNDVRTIKKQGKVALPIGIENGAPLDGDLENLRYFRDRGASYITIVHGKNNHLSDSSYDDTERWGGLSPFGRVVIEAMNEVGIVIDMSHLSDKAAWEVLEITKVPVAATHSSLRHFVPGFHRNIPDEMVMAVAETGGVVMINFGSGFVSAPARKWSDTRKELINELRGKYPEDEAMVTSMVRAYEDENPYPYASVEIVVDHIDRVVQLTSIDHVGLGSDYEGVGPTMPPDLKDVSKYPIVVQELWDRGYSREDILKVLGENYMRVWAENERYAQSRGNPVSCRLD